MPQTGIEYRINMDKIKPVYYFEIAVVVRNFALRYGKRFI